MREGGLPGRRTEWLVSGAAGTKWLNSKLVTREFELGWCTRLLDGYKFSRHDLLPLSRQYEFEE